MTHLYLIRHGEAVGAVERRMADQGPGTGLTPLGREQATRLRDRLAATHEITPDVFIVSTYPRAQETAAIIAPALGDPPILFDPEVQELRLGEADGMSYEDFAAAHGRPDFRHNPFRPIAPGGESWAAFVIRAGAALQRITETYAGQTILIVCHGGIVDNTFIHFMNRGMVWPLPYEFLTHNTAITEWHKRESADGTQRWRLLRYNDALHLRDHIRWTGVAAEPAVGADAPAAPLPTEDRAGRDT